MLTHGRNSDKIIADTKTALQSQRFFSRLFGELLMYSIIGRLLWSEVQEGIEDVFVAHSGVKFYGDSCGGVEDAVKKYFLQDCFPP